MGGTVCFLTREVFVTWLHSRKSAGESMSAIGRSLGVSQPAVSQWLTGASGVSTTTLLLAELQMRTPGGLTCSEWPAETS
jgi:DNA-binding transcriptional regulator YdaS (Cro superfamily)